MTKRLFPAAENSHMNIFSALQLKPRTEDRDMSAATLANTPRYSVQHARILQLPRIQDPRGNLTFIEAEEHVPFAFKRAYYIYDVPGGSSRGGHAHKQLQQLMIAMAGSFDVILDDGREKRTFQLNRSYFGLYIPPMIWRDLDNFSSGSVCMVLASDYYEEEDYYRNYEDYRRAMRELQ